MSAPHIAPAPRSNTPIFWSLFGAGGMLSALLGPALVFITGVAVPLGLPSAASGIDYAHLAGFARHWAGKGFLFIVVSLFLWHAAHRIFHSLHDIGIPNGTPAKLVCYGFALLGTLALGATLLAVGFAA